MKRKASHALLRSSEKVDIATSVTVVDPDGDLQVDFKKDGAPVRPMVGLLVNRHTLCLASPVFRAMLADDTPFRRSSLKNKDGVEVVYLEDDNPACMLIIMNAMHLQGDRVPRHLKFGQLYQIALLCDKYDLGRSLGSWGQLWAKPYVDYLDEELYARLLFVAFVFKAGAVFTEVTKYIIVESVVKNGHLFLGNEPHDFNEGLPESIRSSMAAAREETVAQILATCHQHTKDLRDLGFDGRPCCRHNSEECNALNLGSVLQQLPDLHGEPDAFAPYLRSVADLRYSVSNIQHIEDMSIVRDAFKDLHAASCDSGYILSRKVEEIIQSVEGLQLEEITSLPAPQVPVWLRVKIEEIQDRDGHGNDLYEVVMRYAAVSDMIEMPLVKGPRTYVPELADTRFKYIPMIRCTDCPGRLYEAAFQGFAVSDFEHHLETDLHKQRRKKKLGK